MKFHSEFLLSYNSEKEVFTKMSAYIKIKIKRVKGNYMENQTEKSILNLEIHFFKLLQNGLVIISSAIAMFIGVVGLTSPSPQIGLAYYLGSIFNYFVGYGFSQYAI